MAMMIGATAASLVVLVLTAGAVGHALRPSVLTGALHAQGTVAPRLIGPLAAAVPAAEAVPAVLAAHALLADRPGQLRVAMAAGAALLCGYAAYGLVVARTRRDVPCGCSAAGTPMNGWVVARAAALAAAAGWAVAAAGPAAAATGGRAGVAALAGAVFAILLWELPALPSAAAPAR
ncbi:MauE/DoxX family redox-associated membrane protein [Actinomadura sp. WMMB 499]|uniref:MauE/DoxX family redox-associated membrane protein n=1 Tax=Actinomadura sp. WMMB 499 TaxID=1219491 RepID=UPI001245005E|nr:MauE/DoxX family redox-associated membrane protein [Actinomadura sp. WMMB 499]QFG21354.1 methylamine utilization protein MauE [Actinomadura sp. WMMB 499]